MGKFLTQRTDKIDSFTGEVTYQEKTIFTGSDIRPTDEYIKVTKYLSLIFAFVGIPLKYVPICYLLAEAMDTKTNRVYIHKGLKQKISEMLDISDVRIRHMVMELKQYDLIRATDIRGVYELNAFIFSVGSTIETRALQAHFDCVANEMKVINKSKNYITGETVITAVRGEVKKKLQDKDKQIPGQISMEDFNNGGCEDTRDDI